jgi:hypothetical protein
LPEFDDAYFMNTIAVVVCPHNKTMGGRHEDRSFSDCGRYCSGVLVRIAGQGRRRTRGFPFGECPSASSSSLAAQQAPLRQEDARPLGFFLQDVRELLIARRPG